jgi:hypothetical protein
MDNIFGDSAAEQERIRQGELNMQKYKDKIAVKVPSNIDGITADFSGPNYSYADELKTPAEVGVRSGGDVGAISDAVSAVNYYTDVIGFGQRSGINKSDLKPMGLRYFMSTGFICSNGATMYEYIDNTPKGDLVGKRIAKAVSEMGLPVMKGLASGMLEDARDALNPIPIFNAAIGSGYPRCRQVTLPVGDLNGNTRSPYDSNNIWIKGNIGPGNTQTQWVQDRDSYGNPLYMNKVDYENDAKIYYPDGTPIEGFESPAFWEKYIDKKTAASLLFGGLVVAAAVFIVNKKE